MLPNFLVIGANKAGTTALHRYLRAHPEIFMSTVKEPCYFAPPTTGSAVLGSPDKIITGREDYEALFAAVDGEKVVGESSTSYLSRRAALRIRDELPDVKLVAILRDPVDRARSAYDMHVARGVEPLKTFEAAVEEELRGSTWREYLRGGLYAKNVASYRELFEPEQLKVFLYEDFRDTPLAVLQETFEWLGVDPMFEPDVSRQFNVSAIPRSETVRRVVEQDSGVRTALRAVLPSSARSWTKDRVRRWNRAAPTELSDDVRRRLVEYYEDDVRRLEGLVGRDLSGWLQV